jgi:hypothetical protein
MNRKVAIGTWLLALVCVMPTQAQNGSAPAPLRDPPALNADNSPFNFHIGGGFGVPLGSTATFAGLSGTFQVGAGPNLDKHNSIFGEFLWQGLPANRTALLPIIDVLCPPTSSAQVCNLGSFGTSVNLYALTADYSYHRSGERYGYYGVVGGGWYYRKAQLKNFQVGPGTVCEPVWNWWGYGCVNGFVETQNTLVNRGVSSGGVNAGGGLTINLTNSGLKFYVEARYHYSPQGGRVSTQIIPVSFGLRW